MADEKEFDDGEGNGVGTWNDGNSDSTAGPQTTGGGGGAGGGSSTQTSTNTPSTSGTSGTSGNSSTSGTDTFIQKEAEIDKILAKWMAASEAAISLTFEQVVDLYLENKLGFGPNGKDLKKKYKEANRDMDPAKIDEEVDAQLNATRKEFTTSGSSAKDELQAKYNEFKSSSFEALGNLKKMTDELARTIANAYMPTSIGPVAPNPLSVALKLYVGLTALKKLIDRVVISMTVLMAAARSIGADKSPAYITFIDSIHSLLNPMMKQIEEKEKEGDNLKNAAKAQRLLAAKEGYSTTSLVSGNTVSAKELEEMARNEFGIYIWPLDNKDRNKLYNILGVNPYLAMSPGIGVIAGFVDLATTTDKERRAQMLVDYNKFLVDELHQFEQDWETAKDALTTNNSTTITTNQNEPSMGGKDTGNTGGGVGFADGNSDSGSNDAIGG